MRGLTKHIAFISFTMLMAVLLVSILAWISLKPSFEKKGFNRIFYGNGVEKIFVKNKDEMIVDYAGETKHNFFFSTRIPGTIWMTDRSFNSSEYLNFPVPKDRRLGGYFNCFVDSPSVKILAGNMPAVIECRLNEPPVVYRFPSRLFTRVVSIGSQSYIFRGLDTSVKTADQIFFKGNPVANQIIRENGISVRANDGGISSDGKLNYDSATNLLVYVPFYKNEILCMDTNLNLIKTFNTIDTQSITSLKINVVNPASQQPVLTNVNPDKDINSISCTYRGKLYNISKQKADNEEDDVFGKNTAVDIYDIRSGKYEHSFYIPRHKYERLHAFRVIDDNILVLYKSCIVYYRVSK